MKVSSPVGDFPYTFDRLELREGTLRVHGRLGTWPAQIEIGSDDLAQVGRRLAKPLAIGAGVVVLAIALRRRR